MIQTIKSIDDVKTFLQALKDEDLNFHPDDLMSDYVYVDTGDPFYSDQDALIRNTLLDQAFEVCEKEGVDIYELCLEIFQPDFFKE